MGVFALDQASRRFFRAAAVAAAHELGLVDGAPETIAAVAARAGVRRQHRLRALAAVLARDDAWHDPPAPPPPAGWGLLAQVIRRDQPLDAAPALAQFHAHLQAAGAPDAQALAARLHAEPDAARGLLDLGGGAGVYARAFVDATRADAPPDALPDVRATLVDRAEVLALAPPHPAIRPVAADLFDVTVERHGIALLANVLHLYGTADAARLVARAAALADTVVVEDLRHDSDAGVYFALTMALYTDEGEVHDTARIAAWMRAAGSSDVRIEALGDDIVVLGTRPR